MFISAAYVCRSHLVHDILVLLWNPYIFSVQTLWDDCSLYTDEMFIISFSDYTWIKVNGSKMLIKTFETSEICKITEFLKMFKKLGNRVYVDKEYRMKMCLNDCI